MKKLLTLMMVVGMFSLVACGSSAEEKEAAEAKAEQVANDLMKGMDEATTEDAVDETATAEEAPEHVCDEKCKTEGCAGPRCGEKGHSCTEACSAKKAAEENGENTDTSVDETGE